MERVASNFNFTTIEKILFGLDEDHSSTTLSRLKNELNKFFVKAKCKDILYTVNTDKLFFGMRVYPIFDGGYAMELLGDSTPKPFDSYYLEFDSKLYDPMLNLSEKEITAILLHEIGHIVYDVATIDEVKKQVDLYFAGSGDYADLKASKGYRELIAYALKDSIVKAGSLISKFGNTEMIADTFVTGCGYGPDLESAMKKISHSAMYLNKDVDDRFITLSWVLRLRTEFEFKRIPAVKTLNKAKTLTASRLEDREISYAADIMAKLDEPVHEGAIDNIKSRFSKKFADFKAKGVRSIRNDVYELNLRLRCAESEMDLMYVIRTVNSDVAILQDYLTEEIPEDEREEIVATLQELYDIRQRAAKEKKVRDTSSSVINVVYPDML